MPTKTRLENRSWGRLGNDKIRINGVDHNFDFLTQYTFANNGIFGGANPVAYTGLLQQQTANPNIHWEVGTTYNIGLETKLLNADPPEVIVLAVEELNVTVEVPGVNNP